MKKWLFPLILFTGVFCYAEESQPENSLFGPAAPGGMFSAKTYIAKNKKSNPPKRKSIVKTNERCQIWGEYADNFVAYLWDMAWCCSPDGAMCEGHDKKGVLHKFYFDKLTESQDLSAPTEEKIFAADATPTRSRLCPNKWVRVTFDGKVHLFQYRPFSTLEFTVEGGFSEKPEVWMKRLCNFDAEELFEGPKTDDTSADDATVPPHRAGQGETKPSAGTASVGTDLRTNGPDTPAGTQPAPASAIYLFGDYFFVQDAPSTLATVRLLQTADKKQELKVNFSGGEKSAFLQKLQKQFAQNPSKITYCDNNNILFETQQEVYQAFILAPNAITVLARPAGFPANKQLRDELCGFAAVDVW